MKRLQARPFPNGSFVLVRKQPVPEGWKESGSIVSTTRDRGTNHVQFSLPAGERRELSPRGPRKDQSSVKGPEAFGSFKETATLFQQPKDTVF